MRPTHITTSLLFLSILSSSAMAEGPPCALPSSYEVKPWMEPHSLTGDFDADRIPDTAELVVQRKSGKKGIAVCSSKERTFVLLGAGTAIGAGGDDFDWMNEWEIYVPTAWKSFRPATISARDALHVGVESGAGGIVYLEKKKFRWIQFGE